MKQSLKIGTRGSPLALEQAALFIAALKKAHPELAAETVIITTTGDKSQKDNVSLAALGGDKGLFAKELEEALLAGTIDCAVHSMKDMPGKLPEGLEMPCVLPREDVRDAFFSTKAKTLDELPAGSLIGTSSPRRQAIILARRPDLKTVTFRGNVGSRLQKLAAGEVDATVLAVAGLKRLGKMELIQSILEPDVMLPAVAQGAIAIEVRSNDADTQKLIAPVNCHISQLRVSAERAFLAEMDGSCKTPLAALMSEPDGAGRVRFDALTAEMDGTHLKKVTYMMTVTHMADAVKLGLTAALDLKKQLKDHAA